MRNTVLTYLEDTVKKHPDKTAIVDLEGSITFDELKDKACRIASYINNFYGINKKPILVYLPKCKESIVCFLAALYSGNFYTPTDVDFPWVKVQSVIDQLRPSLYFSSGKYIDKLVENGVPREKIIDINAVKESDYNISLNSIIDTDIAYVLFTSGSTGVPKGVAIMQRSIIDYIDWAVGCYSITDTNAIGNQAPFYFDNSTLDIYLMLATGATLYIIPSNYYAFPAKLLTYICENQIDTIFWVPSVLITVANYGLLDRIDCSCLKNILFAGEVMPNKQLNYWRKCLPEALFSNLYGPTEITVDCTYYIVDRDFKDEEPLPIGYPCNNSGILVLDENDNNVTTPEVMGELCVRGSSLAAGYWNNEEKTNEVFVQNPLNKNIPEKIYRTGDIVYYNSFGELVFAGRKDFQIKHSGYRIELGEIESAAMGCDTIKNVCASYNSKEKQIVLFYEGDVTDSEIRDYLLVTIPKYMVPTQYYKLKEFPYNDNGKIDRKYLNKEYLS